MGKSVLICFLVFISSYASVKGITADCEIVKYVTHVKVIKQRLLQTDSVIYQVNNRKGENDSNITIFYSKSNVKSTLHCKEQNQIGYI